jgi:hypothetical protein
MTTSLRSQLEARARREFIEQENRKEREKEDRANYEAYVRGLRDQNYRLAPANRMEIPAFESIAPHLDQSKTDAKRRWDEGLVDYYSAFNVTLLRELADRPLEPLQPDVFDGIPRSKSSDPIDQEKVREAFQDFYDTEIRFRRLNRAQRKHVVGLMAAFCERNDLNPESLSALSMAWSVLWETAQIPHAEVEPEPEAPVESAEDREKREAAEREEKRRAYFENVIIVDPRNGQQHTAYTLERLSAEDYRIVMGMPKLDMRTAPPSRRV